MIAAFPSNQSKIFDYNRVIKDLNVLSKAEFIETWLRNNTELVKSDAFIANLDLNKELRAYRRSDAYMLPANELKARRKEILRQQKLIDKGELTTISLTDAPFAIK